MVWHGSKGSPQKEALVKGLSHQKPLAGRYFQLSPEPQAAPAWLKSAAEAAPENETNNNEMEAEGEPVAPAPVAPSTGAWRGPGGERCFRMASERDQKLLLWGLWYLFWIFGMRRPASQKAYS